MDATSARKPYPSDLTDPQWELIELLIPPQLPGGRPRDADMREVVNAKYDNYALYGWLARQPSIRWRLEIVIRPDGAKGFVLLPRRWVAERTFRWLGRWRRMSRDYEHLSSSSECMVWLVLIGRMLRRLAPPQQHIPFKYRVAA